MSESDKTEQLAEIITDFFNAVEAAAVNGKHQIAELYSAGAAAAQDAALNVSKLFWEKKQGEKGEYEQTSEKANQNSDLWRQLKDKVKEHKGFWQNGGYKFWFHQQDENVIDRRKA